MDVVKYHPFEITEINDICVISCWTVDAHIMCEEKFSNTNHFHTVLISVCQIYGDTCICLDEFGWFYTDFNADLFC